MALKETETMAKQVFEEIEQLQKRLNKDKGNSNSKRAIVKALNKRNMLVKQVHSNATGNWSASR